MVGWREWVALPDLGIPALKAKIDTGARTSALHAFELERFTEAGTDKVRFGIHPLRRKPKLAIHCVADVVDERLVTDSGGHTEKRLVIVTPITLGQMTWPIEITLTNRDTMLFRLLLGRTAMHHRLTVDPTASFLTGKTLSRAYHRRKKSTR